MQFPRNFNIGPPFYSHTATTTSKKNNTFMSTPLQDCSLSDVPGVGEVSHSRLIGAGIATTEQLMGQFLIVKRDRDAMTQRLMALGIRTQEAVKIATALENKGRATVAV
jgi:hypothetical protein